MTMQNTTPPPRDGIDLHAYLAAHSGDLLLMLGVATLITVGHWRNWLWPDDLKLADGTSPDPRAGNLNVRKMLGDFLFVPSLMVLGLLVLGFRPDTALACAVVALFAFVGSGFIMATFEKARDGALGIFLQAASRWLGGGK